jgi:hypothetical protein
LDWIVGSVRYFVPGSQNRFRIGHRELAFKGDFQFDAKNGALNGPIPWYSVASTQVIKSEATAIGRNIGGRMADL